VTFFSQMRLITYKLFRNQKNPFGEEIVTLEHFGRIIGFFPPLVNAGDGKWGSSVLEMCSERWFWGDSSRIEVDHYLRLSPAGSFVVRFANQASFRLSIRCQDETTKHIVIRHRYESLKYSVKGVIELEEKEFASLRSVAEAVAGVIGLPLVTPTHSPFF